jgi:hypothetical protein
VAAGLLAAQLSPTLAVAVLPLALVGMAGTQVECAATGTIQRTVPDRVRAFALGVTDTAMVTAAMLAAVATPWLADLLGPRPLFALLAAATLALVAASTLPAHIPTARSLWRSPGRILRATAGRTGVAG